MGSAISTVVALLICSFLASCTIWAKPPENPLRTMVILCVFASPMCLVAWLLALPMVLGRNIIPWGTTGMFLYGCSLGPLVLYGVVFFCVLAMQGPALPDRIGIALTSFQAFHGQDAFLRNMMLFAILISVVTTVLYLAFLHYHRRIQSTNL